MRLLLVEDSPPTRDLLRRSLEGEGHSVATASRSSTGLRLATGEAFDAMVIDVMLPDGSGLDLCRAIRQEGVTTPILFLTARGEVRDRIAGLDAGADDYLGKPFALAELHARIRALGRRGGVAGLIPIEHGTVRIDFSARRFVRAGVAVPLTAREWGVLEALAARSGRVVPREEILDEVWSKTGPAASDSLDVILSRLRRKLGGGEEGVRIRTVRGEGFVLEVLP